MSTSGRKRSAATLKPARKKRLVKKIIRTRRSKKPRYAPDVVERESLEAQPIASEAESLYADVDATSTESAPAHVDESLARLTSEVAVTSESIAAVLASMTEHLADDKLVVKTHTSQQVVEEGFPEWSQMQHELQGTAAAEQGQQLPQQPSSLLAGTHLDGLLSRALEWNRERPWSWTAAVFATGFFLGALLARLA
jgi:hypothetical protein